MRVLILADPVEKLKSQSDTSLYFARAALQLQGEVYFAQPHQLSWREVDLFVSAQKAQDFKRGEKVSVRDPQTFSIRDFDLIFIRKDPPFDSHYIKLCWLLSPFEKKIFMINRPQALIHFHEKMLPFEIFHRGFISEEDLIPQWVSRSKAEIESILKSSPEESFVVKPWLGYGGNEIHKMTKQEVLAVSDRFEKEDLILQVFDSNVLTLGDRRVLFWRGKYIGDFVRMPQSGSVVSNLAQGGAAEKRDLSKADQKLIWKIEKFLEAEKIDFAGADFIGSRLNELNITSPTGLGAIEDLYGKDLSLSIFEDLKKHL